MMYFQVEISHDDCKEIDCLLDFQEDVKEAFFNEFEASPSFVLWQTQTVVFAYDYLDNEPVAVPGYVAIVARDILSDCIQQHRGNMQ